MAWKGHCITDIADQRYGWGVSTRSRANVFDQKHQDATFFTGTRVVSALDECSKLGTSCLNDWVTNEVRKDDNSDTPHAK